MFLRKRLLAQLAVLLCGASGSVAHGVAGLMLVDDGRPTSVIVTNGRPTDGQAQAAAELQEHLRLMTGATIPIVKENELKSSSSKRSF